MTESRLFDEDVHLASEESSRHSTEVSLRGVKLTRARALLSEWGLYRYQWRLCQPESHSGLILFIMCYFLCLPVMYVLVPGAYVLTGQVMTID